MSQSLPHLLTSRLLLRALESEQAAVLSSLANGPKIADNTANDHRPIPWKRPGRLLTGMQDKYRAGNLLNWACTCAKPAN